MSVIFTRVGKYSFAAGLLIGAGFIWNKLISPHIANNKYAIKIPVSSLQNRWNDYKKDEAICDSLFSQQNIQNTIGVDGAKFFDKHFSYNDKNYLALDISENCYQVFTSRSEYIATYLEPDWIDDKCRFNTLIEELDYFLNKGGYEYTDHRFDYHRTSFN